MDRSMCGGHQNIRCTPKVAEDRRCIPAVHGEALAPCTADSNTVEAMSEAQLAGTGTRMTGFYIVPHAAMGATSNYDVIVIGVGAAGSAATYHLAKRGASVLGLERFSVPNEMGSSRGYTRIINPALREKPQYVPITLRALELWNELQEAHRNRLINQTGSLRGWTGPDYTGHRNSFEETVELCEDQSLPYEVLDGDEVRERYPGYDPTSDSKYVYQPDGGLLDPQECIIAHMNEAHAHGAEIRAHERVETWESTTGGVRVRTNKGEYEADDLVVTAGSWVADLVDGLGDIKVKRAVMGWFRPEHPEQYMPGTFPSFGWDVDGGYFYGTPAHRIDGMKVGGTSDIDDAPQVDSDEMDRMVTAEEEANLREFLEEHLPGAAGPTLNLKACITTQASDMQYVLDTHPDHPSVHVAGGFSGSGFMTASAVGEIAANLALDGTTDFDLEPFEIDRF